MATKRTGEPYRAGLIETRRARLTGAQVSIYRAAEAGLDIEGGPYVDVCEDHGTLANFDTLAQARHHLPAVDWCESCQSRVAARAKNAEIKARLKAGTPWAEMILVVGYWSHVELVTTDPAEAQALVEQKKRHNSGLPWAARTIAQAVQHAYTVGIDDGLIESVRGY